MASRSSRITQTRSGPWLQIGSLKDFAHSTIELINPELPESLDGFRVVHLTDFHARPGWTPAFDRLIEAVANEKPDLIAMTGDWVDDKFDHRPGLRTAMRFAEKLSPIAPLGTFSVVGNHDGDLIAPHLIDAGLHVLIGETTTVSFRDATVRVTGLAGVARDDVDDVATAAIASQSRPSELHLVLVHYPDAIRSCSPLRPSVVLAGHTHAGQVCLPNGRPLITHDSLPKSQAGGLHEIDGMWLHIGQGVGTSTYEIRLFCPAAFDTIVFRRA